MPTKSGEDNYVAVIQAPAPLGHGNRDGRNINHFHHKDFRNAIRLLSSFHGRLGPGSAASHRATALAFIARSISAYMWVVSILT